MPVVNCITDLFYNVYETLTVIVSNVYLFYVSFAGLYLTVSTSDVMTSWHRVSIILKFKSSLTGEY